MRLLATKDLIFHEFLGAAIPPYAILSHTWEKDEVSYKDMLGEHSLLEAKVGFQKTRKVAQVALSIGHNYIWVDTCCIDKSSSAELTEAINSMYQWYKDSAQCLVYLADIPDGSDDICSSRWFTRGWTLQELIAPSKLLFLSAAWQPVLHSENLLSAVSKRTGIPIDALWESGGFCPSDWCVAKKMSWAAHRETTRIEDMAYCLLGLFEVNMPLLYGEGNRAFTRLQEEIIRRHNDYTIFLWRSIDTDISLYRGLLARHPNEFKHITNVEFKPGDHPPFLMTNAGLRLDVRLLPLLTLRKAIHALDYPLTDPATREKIFTDAAHNNIFFPLLSGTRVSIFLIKLDAKEGSQYARIWPSWTFYIPSGLRLHSLAQREQTPQRFYVRENLAIPINHILTSIPIWSKTLGNYSIFQIRWAFDTSEEVEWTQGTEKTNKLVARWNRIVIEDGYGCGKCFDLVFGYDSEGLTVLGKGRVGPMTETRPSLEECLKMKLMTAEYLEISTWEWECSVQITKKVVNDRLVLCLRASVF